MIEHNILWRRLDRDGHEYARIHELDRTWRLAGSAVFDHAQKACCLQYTIKCDSEWRTVSADVIGWIGNQPINLKIFVDEAGNWFHDGSQIKEVFGCTDIDLNFSPSTNLLPIRRLALEIGKEEEVQAAWLRFPTFKLEPLDQSYTRLSENIYRYESAGGTFTTELEVNAAGLVTRYPEFCEAILVN